MFINEIMIDWNLVSPDSYVRSIESLRGLDSLHFTAPVTYFVGENGSGKSTLLEAMAVADGFNPEGGSAVFHRDAFAHPARAAGRGNPEL